MTEETIIPAPAEGDGVPVQPLSITDKFIGILSEPGNTYENIRQTGPRKTDWLVPILVLTIIIAALTFIRMSSPAMREQIRQQQQEYIDRQIASGQMTQQQADQAADMMEKMGPLQAVFSVVGVLIMVPLVFFIIALFYWLVIKYGLRSTISYSVLLGVYGLTAYFGVIDQILAIILSFVTGNMTATLSPALFMKPDLASPVYKLVNALNPITFWSMYVLGIGISTVGGVSKTKAYILIFGLWLLWTLVMAFLKLPIPGM